jgi:hypothetical protein
VAAKRKRARRLFTVEEIDLFCQAALVASKNGTQFADYIRLMALCGDAALFDILVLALSVQVQVVVFQAWGCIHQVFSKTISFLHPSFQRDLLTLAYTLNCLRDFCSQDLQSDLSDSPRTTHNGLLMALLL